MLAARAPTTSSVQVSKDAWTYALHSNILRVAGVEADEAAGVERVADTDSFINSMDKTSLFTFTARLDLGIDTCAGTTAITDAHTSATLAMRRTADVNVKPVVNILVRP
ncbi:hypothetical protein PHYPSEUDO_015315 [Phytophthora pseudosyringae]|uniref:Uncharacterized protein n=1 Tax=Phytophthora pseudosyringae TaxID=221518 RepID=A0A8T1W3G1_9STRA|nr:hypothetical protein PHYPSEUDO_015315 [Phytophthora pseudosyringae]